jgi:hypothetical protein
LSAGFHTRVRLRSIAWSDMCWESEASQTISQSIRGRQNTTKRMNWFHFLIVPFLPFFPLRFSFVSLLFVLFRSTHSKHFIG